MTANSARRPSFLLAALATAAGVLAAGCSVASEPAPASEAVPTATAATAASSATISATPSPTTAPTPSATFSAAPSPSASLPRGWKSCSNSAQGFEIGYPEDWYTTQLNPQQACQQFDPMVFTIPVDGEYPLTALNAVQTTGVFDPAVVATADPIDAGTILREQTTVDGRPAVRYEWSINETGHYPAGTMRYGYAIDRDGLEFAVFTMAHPGVSPADYADWKAVVDQAVDTLRFP